MTFTRVSSIVLRDVHLLNLSSTSVNCCKNLLMDTLISPFMGWIALAIKGYDII